MIALMTGDTEEPLLEDGILPVPKREGEADALVVIRDTCKTVLAPPVGARSRVIMGEMRPGISVGRVVFADSGLGT